MKNNGKRILNVTVRRMLDDSPDTSYLGEFSNSSETEFAINHRGRNGSPNEYAYFNPGSVEPFDGKKDSWHKGNRARWHKAMLQNAEADYKRMLALDNGEFCYVGIRAEAEIQAAQFGAIQTITSGGLWGVESDSTEDYLASIEKEELSDLRSTLADLGFSKRAISAAFKNIAHKGF
jgi:hypothetical protein